MSRRICIIPARGGSKRIPKKNIKFFFEKPIIAYSIEAAIKSNLFDIVMVSTDDEDIAIIAKQYGAEVPFLRNKNASNDNASLFDAIKSVLEDYQKEGAVFTEFCCLLATAPFVTAIHLKDAFSKLSSEVNGVMSVCEFDFPIQRFLNLEEGLLSIGDDQQYFSRSQDLGVKYHDAGQFYFGKVNEYLESKSFIGLNPQAVILDKNSFVDIDTEADWKRAEFLFSYKDGFKE